MRTKHWRRVASGATLEHVQGPAPNPETLEKRRAENLPQIIMYQQRSGARAEYLQQEKERVAASVSLAEKFPDLRSLTVNLVCFAPGGLVRLSELKCTFNLAHARSLFRFDCPNHECIGGNFDLSTELLEAISDRRQTVTGEAVCRGWRSKTLIDNAYCDHMLRYKLTLEY